MEADARTRPLEPLAAALPGVAEEPPVAEQRTPAHAPRGQSAASILHKMFRRDVVYVFGGLLPLAISALVMPLLTRILGQKEFGVASFCVAISTVLVLVLSLGMQTGIQREYPKPDGELRVRRLAATSIAVIAALTTVLALTADAWAPVIGAGSFAWAIRLTVYWGGAAAVAYQSLGYFRAADRLGRFLLVVLTQSVGAQVIGIVMTIWRGHTAHSYLVGLLVGQVIASAIAIVMVRPSPSGFSRLGGFLRVLAFTVPLVPQQMAAFILWSGDRIVVERDLGSAAQAKYTVAYAVGAITINLVSQLNLAWMPRVFAMSLDQRRSILVQVQRRLTSLLQPAVLGLALLVPFLLVLASPRSYRAHDDLLFVTLLIVPTALPYSIALANTRTLLAHGLSLPLALVTVASATANMILNVLLVPHFGLMGSAGATLAAYALLAWLSTLVVRHEADRLPGRIGIEARQWAVAGLCIATGFLPASLINGLPLRLACVAIVIVFGLTAVIRTGVAFQRLGAHLRLARSPKHRRAR